jgi:hypothetical protein
MQSLSHLGAGVEAGRGQFSTGKRPRPRLHLAVERGTTRRKPMERMSRRP